MQLDGCSCKGQEFRKIVVTLAMLQGVDQVRERNAGNGTGYLLFYLFVHPFIHLLFIHFFVFVHRCDCSDKKPPRGPPGSATKFTKRGQANAPPGSPTAVVQ